MVISRSFASSVLCILASIGLSGCASIVGPSQATCQNSDWSALGAEAAKKGDELDSSFAYFIKQCAEDHGVQPNRELFAAGFSEGVKQFCTVKNGNDFGLAGGHYKNTCPADLESDFLKGYYGGKIISLERSVNRLRNRVKELENENSELKDKID